MRKIILFMLSAFVINAFAQKRQVAILEPVDSDNALTSGVKLMLRSYLAEAVTNTDGYEAYDRTNLQQILGEQDFQRSGFVSNDDIKKIGEMTGVQYILVTEASKLDGQTLFISATILDVETARMIKKTNTTSKTDVASLQKSAQELASFLLLDVSKAEDREALLKRTREKEKAATLLAKEQAKQEKAEKRRKYKNSYIAWGMAGAGYPWNLVTSIEYRGGGIVGWGLYGDIGMDFTHIEYSFNDGSTTERAKTVKTAFRYAAGAKFYPYKGLFVDFGYGSIAKPSVSKVSVPYYGAYEVKKRNSAARKAVENSHGILVHAGYNLALQNTQPGFFLGISGGISYDVINKVIAPSVNLKIGLAFSLK